MSDERDDRAIGVLNLYLDYITRIAGIAQLTGANGGGPVPAPNTNIDTAGREIGCRCRRRTLNELHPVALLFALSGHGISSADPSGVLHRHPGKKQSPHLDDAEEKYHQQRDGDGHFHERLSATLASEKSCSLATDS
jgi:hypothetical protein